MNIHKKLPEEHLNAVRGASVPPGVVKDTVVIFYTDAAGFMQAVIPNPRVAHGGHEPAEAEFTAPPICDFFLPIYRQI